MRSLIAFLVGIAGLMAHAQNPRGYYRFPTVHKDTLVFTAEGDLWKVGIQGGAAQLGGTALDSDLPEIALGGEDEGILVDGGKSVVAAGVLGVGHQTRDADEERDEGTHGGTLVLEEAESEGDFGHAELKRGRGEPHAKTRRFGGKLRQGEESKNLGRCQRPTPRPRFLKLFQ